MTQLDNFCVQYSINWKASLKHILWSQTKHVKSANMILFSKKYVSQINMEFWKQNKNHYQQQTNMVKCGKPRLRS